MRFVITTGVGYTRDGVQISDVLREMHIDTLLKYAAEKFGGATLIEHRGSYVNRKGECIMEDSISFQIYTSEKKKILDFADDVKFLFKQESVIVAEHNAKVKFI